jgi:hypothetical protein
MGAKYAIMGVSSVVKQSRADVVDDPVHVLTKQVKVKAGDNERQANRSA